MGRLSTVLVAVAAAVSAASIAAAQGPDGPPQPLIADTARAICADVEQAGWTPGTTLTATLAERLRLLFADVPGSGLDAAREAGDLTVILARGEGSVPECVRNVEIYTASLLAPVLHPDEPLAEATRKLLTDIERPGNTRDLALETNPSPRASRIFAGPAQYPPDAFAAYAVIVFRSRATSFDRTRHVLICEAFVSGLPAARELQRSLGVPPDKQIVTVWPVTDDAIADSLNERSRDLCPDALDNYDLAVARKALGDAALVGIEFVGQGPYLIAWSPAGSKGRPDAVVLRADLSHVDTIEQANAVFRDWVDDIEQNPELWSNGWDVAAVRVAIRNWVDQYGDEVLKLFGDR